MNAKSSLRLEAGEGFFFCDCVIRVQRCMYRLIGERLAAAFAGALRDRESRK
jgi:hypothetical protein